MKRILQIGNWPPPVCGWTMSMVGLRKELEARGWDCQVMNLNENRKVRNPECIDVQSGWDYFTKVFRKVRRGYAIHIRVNGETKKGYLLALCALGLARIYRRPALLTYAGGHQQSYYPAPKGSFRHLAFSFLFRFPHRIYCNSEKVKQVLLRTDVPQERVVPIPHFSSYYLEFTPTSLPETVEEFFQKRDPIFFSYLCFRKEYCLEFFAAAIRRFRQKHPNAGFLLVGPGNREMEKTSTFAKSEKIDDVVCIQGSVPHDMFLTMLTRSAAYIRIPVTDGICSSVLEALKLKVPVLCSDNGARPAGAELWQEGDFNGLLHLMEEVLQDREAMVARIPEIELEDNAKKLVDSIKQVCREFPGFEDQDSPTLAADGGTAIVANADSVRVNDN